MINSLEKYVHIYWKYPCEFTHLNAIRHYISYNWTLLDKNILYCIPEASVSIITLCMTSKTLKTITTYPAICWLLVFDNGYSTIWHLVGIVGLIAVMKSPGTYWVWVNCCCHNIGSDGWIAVIRSLALSLNGSKAVCIFSGICGTRWACVLPLHSQPVVRFG